MILLIMSLLDCGYSVISSVKIMEQVAVKPSGLSKHVTSSLVGMGT
jgi:hypothetical protein